MKTKTLLLLLFISSISFSQRMRTRSLPDHIRPYDMDGWFISPGATMSPKLNFISYDPTLSLSGDNVELNALNLEQNSKLGFYLEVGRYHIIRLRQKNYPFRFKDFLNYVDYGLAYKQFRGEQKYDLDILNTTSLLRDTVSYVQNFNSHNVLVFYNANWVLGFNSKWFIQNTLGVNVAYAFSRKIETTDVTSFTQTYQEEPSRLMVGIHYKFGIGIKLTKKIYAIPSVEIPLINGWKWEGGRSTIGYFNSRYRPIIFSIRFAWLTTPDCPRVWDNSDAENNGGIVK